MGCEFSLRLQLYLEGSLSEDQSEQFDRHLAECSACRVLLSETLEGSEQPSWLQMARGGLSSEYELSGVAAVVGNRHELDDQSTLVLPLRYRVLRRLGQGGMGVVWACQDEVLGRAVAIKVLRSAVVTEHDSQRLLQEAAVLGRLNHPGIVRVIGLEYVEDQPALVMELVSGPALSECLRDRTVSDSDAALAVASLASALEYAHQRGVVHRDLKPANILLDDDVTAESGFSRSSIFLVDGC